MLAKENKEENIAIIPARGGSKRIAKKNIKLFYNKPLIAYSIEAAKESGLFDRIIVSTDSDEIAEVAIKYGAEVPFFRPPELSDDYTGTEAVVLHAVEFLRKKNIKMKFVCCIYATAPLIQPKYLKLGLDLLIKRNADSAFSVTTFPYPIFRALKLDDKGLLKMIWAEHMETRSQDLDEAYHDAGQFYWARVDKYLVSGKFFSSNAVPVILPRYMVQDIDTQEDWDSAEIMYKNLQ